MTIEEAKEQLRELILDTESLIVGDAAKGIYRKDLEALRKALEALEKQIPKKVIITTSTVRCSNCNKQLTNKGSLHSDYKFCKWCGQALDWSDSDD